MGSFSLITFLVYSRRKENSIRKILGATTGNIATSMYFEMGLLLVASGVIALPIGWMIAREWLQLFAYQVKVDAWLLISAILALLAVCFSVITGQVLSGARINPVDHLKSE
jgi:putative ABC transport system permease protein